MIGYRWFIRCGAYGRYEPTDKTFDTYQQACDDARRNGYKTPYYGVDHVLDSGDDIIFLDRVKTVEETWYESEGCD